MVGVLHVFSKHKQERRFGERFRRKIRRAWNPWSEARLWRDAK
jgi:hypothetical protein